MSVLGDLADWVEGEVDGDGEFYATEAFGEMVFEMLIDRGYLNVCSECENQHGWRVVYTVECPNSHQCECGECECSECYPDGCECDPDDCDVAKQRRDDAQAEGNDYLTGCICTSCVEAREKESSKIEAAWGI